MRLDTHARANRQSERVLPTQVQGLIRSRSKGGCMKYITDRLGRNRLIRIYGNIMVYNQSDQIPNWPLLDLICKIGYILRISLFQLVLIG